MFCDFCGTENPDASNFCTGCGNNLKETYQPLDGTGNYQKPIQYQKMDFKVQQKFLALRATYHVKDAFENNFMVVKRKFINPFRPILYVETPEGAPIGHIQANIWRTRWTLYDIEGQIHATIHFPFIMFFRKHFEIETPMGWYRSGESIFAYKFDAYAPDGNISFMVDKKIFSIRDSFKIQSFGNLSPFITCLSAVCIDQKFHTKDTSALDFD
ncbi:MAG: hypothetical protein ACXAD7_08995 [Candidatus Kariarchaeaceae archaeon]|jgi:uncharacterized protein YxjI